MNVDCKFETKDLDKLLLLDIKERVDYAIGRLDPGQYESGNKDTALKILKIDKKTLSSLSEKSRELSHMADNLSEKIDYVLEVTGKS